MKFRQQEKKNDQLDRASDDLHLDLKVRFKIRAGTHGGNKLPKTRPGRSKSCSNLKETKAVTLYAQSTPKGSMNFDEINENSQINKNSIPPNKLYERNGWFWETRQEDLSVNYNSVSFQERFKILSVEGKHRPKKTKIDKEDDPEKTGLPEEEDPESVQLPDWKSTSAYSSTETTAGWTTYSFPSDPEEHPLIGWTFTEWSEEDQNSMDDPVGHWDSVLLEFKYKRYRA